MPDVDSAAAFAAAPVLSGNDDPKVGVVMLNGVSTFQLKSVAGVTTILSDAAAKKVVLLDPPVITNPRLTLFDAGTNMWQFTQVWGGPGTTYSFYVSSGSASLVQNFGDCYITTTAGAYVCVVGTNSAGTGTPYCFWVPGI